MIILNATTQNGINLFRQALAENEPLVFPTDTIYGIGAPISDTTANEKIYDIKGREKDKPFPLLIGDLKQLDQAIDQELTDKQQQILKNIWPGPFTVVFKAAKDLNPLFTLNGNVAIRLTSVEWLRDVINELDTPISATSANPSGIEYTGDMTTLIGSFKEKVNYFLIKQMQPAPPSTILNFADGEITILRNSNNLTEEDLLK